MNQPSQPNWWERNWKWMVPVGCLGVLATVAIFASAIFFLVTGMMKSSGAYTEAVAKAKAHPALRQVLGTPIEEGFFIMGKINVSGPSGEADIAIPVSGPGGKATIYVVAAKSGGRWSFSTLAVELKGSKQRIDLLD
ncbi:MAG: cytochrome c oxidase assembly factor Coa1 family protein [Verrucomicrobiales bacterium]